MLKRYKFKHYIKISSFFMGEQSEEWYMAYVLHLKP